MALKLNFEKERIAIPIKDKETDEVLATFYIEKMTPTEYQKLSKKHEIVKWEAPNKRSRPERIVDIDIFAFTLDRIDKLIVAWDGIQDKNGETLDCTRDNKLLIYELHTDIINDVLEEYDNIIEKDKHKKETEEKN